jgi:hypothetical protein
MTTVAEPAHAASGLAPGSPACAKVYVGRVRPSKVSLWTRLTALGLAAGCLSVLLIACALSPSTAGFGTHRQLGMAECGFLARTGLPCPACGMTTSFAWFARGNILASFYLQPMGMVLAVLCSWCVWAGGYIALTGRPLYRAFSIIPEKACLIPLLSIALLAWGWKMYIHVHGIDGWGH